MIRVGVGLKADPPLDQIVGSILPKVKGDRPVFDSFTQGCQNLTKQNPALAPSDEPRAAGLCSCLSGESAGQPVTIRFRQVFRDARRCRGRSRPESSVGRRRKPRPPRDPGNPNFRLPPCRSRTGVLTGTRMRPTRRKGRRRLAWRTGCDDARAARLNGAAAAASMRRSQPRRARKPRRETGETRPWRRPPRNRGK